MTLTINDIQHKIALHYADCRYAESRILFVVMLSVSMPNVIVLSLVAPWNN
jgi:hypothetical protein